MTRLLRIKDVIIKTALARSTIYKYIQLGSFPKPVNLSTNSVAWVEAEVDEWIELRILERDEGKTEFNPS